MISMTTKVKRERAKVSASSVGDTVSSGATVRPSTSANTDLPRSPTPTTKTHRQVWPDLIVDRAVVFAIMRSSSIILGFIVYLSAAQGQLPTPLPNSALIDPTASNETNASFSTVVSGAETITELIETVTLENDSLISEMINSTVETFNTTEENNTTNILLTNGRAAEITIVNETVVATADHERSSPNGTMEAQSTEEVDSEVEGALINTTVELVPTIRRSDVNRSANGIIVPIHHQRLSGGDGDGRTNVSLVFSPSVMNRLSQKPAATKSITSIPKSATDLNDRDNSTTDESLLLNPQNSETIPDPFESQTTTRILDETIGEKNITEHPIVSVQRLSSVAVTLSHVIPSTTTASVNTASTSAATTISQAVLTANAHHGPPTATAVAMQTPGVQFDHRVCRQRRASSLTPAERDSVVSFHFADLEVPIDEALGRLCRYLFGVVSREFSSQISNGHDPSASIYVILNDTINEPEQGRWTACVIIFNADGNAMDAGSVAAMLMKHKSDVEYATIGRLLRISPETEANVDRGYWQLLDDPIMMTMVSAAVVAVCLILVGCLCALVCWHRYTNRFKGEWVVHAGRSPTESEMWYDNDAFAAGQKYPRTRGIHPTYYGRQTAAGQQTDGSVSCSTTLDHRDTGK